MYRQFNIQQFTFCPHSVFTCFVWIWEQTAIISLYSINWLVLYNRDTVCLLRGTDWIHRCLLREMYAWLVYSIQFVCGVNALVPQSSVMKCKSNRLLSAGIRATFVGSVQPPCTTKTHKTISVLKWVRSVFPRSFVTQFKSFPFW